MCSAGQERHKLPGELFGNRSPPEPRFTPVPMKIRDSALTAHKNIDYRGRNVL